MPLSLDNWSEQRTGAALSTSSNVQPIFAFAEDIGSNDAISVFLEDTDAPHGRPRELAGFQSGGKVDVAQGGIYNPGSDRVVLQMMAVRENNLVIRGAFRDRIRAGAQRQYTTDPEPNHARKMRDLIERVKRRRNPLKIDWNGDRRTGVLFETKFDEEGPHDIAYELTFLIATPPTDSGGAARGGASAPTPSLEDLRSQMAANHVAQVAAAEALLVNAVAVAVVSNGLSYVSNAIQTMGAATTTLERVALTTPQRVAQQANAVVAAAESVRAQVVALKTGTSTNTATAAASVTNGAVGLDGLRADAVMSNASADEYSKWWSWQATTQLELGQMLDAMRQAKMQALTLVRSATTLYRVQPGDTLESIALSQLGSRARAVDLGITQDKLVPGQYIRVPVARTKQTNHRTTLGPRG